MALIWVVTVLSPCVAFLCVRTPSPNVPFMFDRRVEEFGLVAPVAPLDPCVICTVESLLVTQWRTTTEKRTAKYE